MQQKYFLYPFGIDGDITPDIPDPTDVTGLVAYQTGFTFDYQRDLTTDPAAKSILRININAILNDITTNVQDYQNNGTPEFITSAQNGGSAFSYRVGAMVRYSASGTAPFTLYMNMVDNNTALPTANNSGWLVMPGGFANASMSSSASNGWTIAANGTFVIMGGTGTTQTLPAPSTVTGMSIGFAAKFGSNFTLATASGAFGGDTINATTVAVGSGQYICVQSDGSAWRIFSASPALLGYVTASNFPSVLSTSGYKKIPDPNSPSGYWIFQWFTVPLTVNTSPQTINFPTGFPNACLQIGIVDAGGGLVTYGAGPGLSATQLELWYSSWGAPTIPRITAIGY